jgi:hypothetical protein
VKARTVLTWVGELSGGHPLKILVALGLVALIVMLAFLEVTSRRWKVAPGE